MESVKELLTRTLILDKGKEASLFKWSQEITVINLKPLEVR